MGASHRHTYLSRRALVQTLLHAKRGTSVSSSASGRQGTLRSLALTAASRRRTPVHMAASSIGSRVEAERPLTRLNG
jgi:hypothetical protein